jgi:hypothetical protein
MGDVVVFEALNELVREDISGCESVDRAISGPLLMRLLVKIAHK